MRFVRISALIHGGTRCQNHKLIPAETGQDIRLAKGFFQDGGYSLSKPGHLGRAQGVIDRLQVVHVAKEQQHGSLNSIRQFHLLFGQEGEAPPVVQPGELIGQ